MLGNRSKKILKVLIIGAGIILAFIIFGIISSRVASQNKTTGSSPDVYINKDQAPEENFKIAYIINKGEGQDALKMDYVLHKEKQNVFDILKELSAEKNFELKYNNNYSFGVFIESIAGIPNGKDGKYWQYYINDKLGEVAADKKEVKAGDKVEWRFEKVPEF